MIEGVAQGEAGEREGLCRTHDRGHAGLAAEGSEFERPGGAPEGEKGGPARGWGGRSPRHAAQQAAGWATRRRPAEKPLAALTPPRGRGKRQSTDAGALVEAIDQVRTAYRVSGLLRVAGEQQVEQTTQDVGRGRGSGRREKRVLPKTRSPIPHSTRQGETLAALTQRCGWKAFGTNAPQTQRSLQAAVWCYRKAYRGERLCKRLTSRVHSAPLLVKLNEHIEGLTSLLTLGVRVLAVMELVLRWSLAQDQARLPNRPPENQQKRTDRPTAERLLQAFAGVSLTIIEQATGEAILRRITPLSGVQEAILQRLGLGTNLYRQLEIQNMGS
jgi:transposase